MKKRNVDWRYLGQNMLLPLGTLGGALVVLGLAFWFHGVHENQFAQYSRNQGNVHSNYDALIVNRRILEQYHHRYGQLHDSGFVGRENRLDWVETIRTTADELNLPHVTYRLAPQVPVIPPVRSAQAGGNMKIHASEIELDIGLLHELDLLRFFSKLRTDAPGLMKVDKCSMQRQEGGESRGSDQPRLTASCKLSVFSVVTSDIPAIGAES